MATQASQPLLPPELILSVVDWIVPPSNAYPIALPPSHPATKTLLSLARTSSITYPAARRLLYTHCLWIDSVHRLQCILESIQTQPSALRRTRPEVPALEHINSLYLCYDEVNDPSPALLVLGLFTLIGPYLRRLVIDIPLRTYDYEDENEPQRDARLTLRSAFLQLTAAEMFCSTRDELWLPTFNPEIFHNTPSVLPLWPKLKTVALYNPDVSTTRFWQEMGSLKHLETVVFTRSDGLEYRDMKSEWTKACGDEKRKLYIVLVNVESLHTPPLGRDWWQGDEFSVREVNVPISYYGDEDVIELCQEWVKRRMLRGEKPTDWT